MGSSACSRRIEDSLIQRFVVLRLGGREARLRNPHPLIMSRDDRQKPMRVSPRRLDCDLRLVEPTVKVRCLSMLIALCSMGCIHYVEPDDPPGTYVSEKAEHVLVLRRDGSYLLKSSKDASAGRWALRHGCSIGLDKIVLQPSNGEEAIYLEAGEQLFGGLTLSMDQTLLKPR